MAAQYTAAALVGELRARALVSIDTVPTSTTGGPREHGDDAAAFWTPSTARGGRRTEALLAAQAIDLVPGRARAQPVLPRSREHAAARR
jgi:histidine ammonia-lyase